MEDPENLGSGMAGAGDNLVKQYPPATHQFLEVPYSVGIVIGEATRDAVPDFASIELDLIAVKGKTEAVRIFALFGDPEMKASERFQALAEHNAAMLEAYRGQDWAAAREALGRCRNVDGAVEGFYQLYEERIAAYEAEPPAADWDGVFVATSK